MVAKEALLRSNIARRSEQPFLKSSSQAFSILEATELKPPGKELK